MVGLRESMLPSDRASAKAVPVRASPTTAPPAIVDPPTAADHSFSTLVAATSNFSPSPPEQQQQQHQHVKPPHSTGCHMQGKTFHYPQGGLGTKGFMQQLASMVH